MEVSNTYTPVEIVHQGRPQTMGVMIATNKNLAKGTVLGKVTASNHYAAYSAANSDGTEKAVGVLAEAVNTTSTGTNAATEAPMITGDAYLRTSKLTGWDAAAAGDLGARTIEQSGTNGEDIIYIP